MNISTNLKIASQCKIANNFFKRFIGLMGKRNLSSGSGLWISPCNSIHMFFMKISLDIIFLDKNLIVVALYENIHPWRITKIIKNANSVLELPVGTIKKSCTSLGNQLEFKNN